MSRQQELLARALALKSQVTIKADALAVRTSILLTRIVFVGLLALPFLEPSSFAIVRVARVNSPPGSELHADAHVPPITPSVPAVPSVKTEGPPAAQTSDAPSTAKASDASGPNLPASTPPAPDVPALPAQTEAKAKPVPPGKQSAPPWTDEQIAAAKQACTDLLGKITVVSEELPPVREGICGAPAPRLLKSVGVSKVRFEPSATLTCPMIAALNTWVTDTLQPAAQKNFGSPIVRVISGSYSCRNRYGLARAPISEHALMNAIDVSGFVLENGKVVRVSKNWGPTEEELKRAQKNSDAASTVTHKAKFQVAASKLGAHDIAKQAEDPKDGAKHKDDETGKPKPLEISKEEKEKQAMSAFLHQAHDGACTVFDTVLGPDTNEAHHDHLHLDMKERKRHYTICQ